MNYWEMLNLISPYDYSIKNKLTNNTELYVEKSNEN